MNLTLKQNDPNLPLHEKANSEATCSQHQSFLAEPNCVGFANFRCTRRSLHEMEESQQALTEYSYL